MAGAKHRRKGTRKELLLVHRHRKGNIPCDRVPLSGAIGGEYRGDLLIGPKGGTRFRGEAKARATGEGFKTIERWLGPHDLLFLWRDRQEPIVCMPWALYQTLMEKFYVESAQHPTPQSDGTHLGAGPGRG